MSDAGIRAHQEWLGLIQPVGLVVAPSAMVAAQVELDRSIVGKWLEYDALLIERDEERVLPEWTTFARIFLEWDLSRLAGAHGGPPLPANLSIALPELGTTLEPMYAAADPHREGAWLLLICVEASGVALDRPAAERGTWKASPHDRFERLLRETSVSAGLLVSDDTIRFVYAPRGESSGWLSFPVGSMATASGRPMLSALYELLKGWRLSPACPESRGLRRLLEDSRKYQNEVSTRLAEQVLGSLYEMARGFQAADDAAAGTILHDTLRQAPTEVYGGLLTTIMRLVFVLYGEDRGMLPQDAAWVEHYGVGALLERLRADKARYPDTMDQRYGAWPRLLTLFRILHDGASHETVSIPSRAGELFDPDRYPFLEGRPFATRRVLGERLTNLPRVSDGIVLRVLERLLMLDEERLSYRALDVEQIGSVYEAMMGFEAQAARGTSIAVKPTTRKPGNPGHPVVNLDRLLALPGAARVKWLQKEADCELSTSDAVTLEQATSLQGLLAALGKRVSPFTPEPIRLGGLVLSPTEERRRSGSHYTPRELTEPIVAATLGPVLESLGQAPTPEQLLDLRICDPAMGSGAFLVGACRYLGDKVVSAWQRSNTMPAVPTDEEPQLYARRLVAQRCLYGVDRNPFAVQLAKLSLWLVTLAREHPFTFLDHALRNGDSLVGLSDKQIAAFHWDLKKPISLWGPAVGKLVKEAERHRDHLERLAETDDTAEKLRLLGESDEALELVRLIGDAVIAAFFSEKREKKREQRRQEYEQITQSSIGTTLAGGRLEAIVTELHAELRISPFHWQVEFSEVFGRTNPGFDAIIGNPPFLGGKRISTENGEVYRDWLLQSNPSASGNADLVAHFFRGCFEMLRQGGALGFIATNTVAQGETRNAGLMPICRNGGTIFRATSRLVWPGQAAVIVSVVHCFRGSMPSRPILNGKLVDRISAFLIPGTVDEEPPPLSENARACFVGCFLRGMGFTFDDESPKASPLADMAQILVAHPSTRERIRPYLGGEEFNDSPTHSARRFAIWLNDLSEQQARREFPELLQIVERLVRPQRELLGNASADRMHKRYWWKYAHHAPELFRALQGKHRAIAISRVSTQFAFSFVPVNGLIPSEQLVVVADERFETFAVLQSRIHEVWARLLASSMKDDMRYGPEDCFETFPRPMENDLAILAVGQHYYEHRAGYMTARGVGLTAVYNSFHNRDEHEPAIIRLRELQCAMDRAVLDAYGWADLKPTCEFVLNYEDGDASSHRRKPWRYRWPDEIRDEVLARLLELNRQRAKQNVTPKESRPDVTG